MIWPETIGVLRDGGEGGKEGASTGCPSPSKIDLTTEI